MTVIPTAWREKLTDIYLTEVVTVIIALGATAFGAVVLAMPTDMMRAPSFQQAFAWAPPYWWGMPMVVLGVLTVSLLMHSRLAAAPPAALLAIMWVAWFIPIIQSPGFVPTAPVVYAVIAAITMTAAAACLVPRRKGVSMDASKPVRITSPANAWAIGMQVLAFVVPFLSVTEGYQPVALEAVSPILADVWQWLLLVVAIIAIAASVGVQVVPARRGALIAAMMRLEAVATVLMAGCLGGLWLALVNEYGYGANPLTQAMVGVLSLAAFARVAQIAWELRKYRRALRDPQTATVEALAQPKES